MVIADWGEETLVPIGGGESPRAGGGGEGGGGGGGGEGGGGTKSGGLRRSGSGSGFARLSLSRRKSAPSLAGMAGLSSSLRGRRRSSNALFDQGGGNESFDVAADGDGDGDAAAKRGGGGTFRRRVSSLTSLSSFKDLTSLVKSPRGSGGGGGGGGRLDDSGSFKVYSVMDLVDRQKWKRLRKFLQTEEGRDQVRASCRGGGGEGEGEDSDRADAAAAAAASFSSPYEHFDGTALHHAVLRGADLDTIRALAVAGGPALISDVDSGGRAALHAAAASPSVALSEDVVIYLIGLSGSRAAISRGDGDGRSPLHLACMDFPPPSPGAGAGLFGGGDGGGGEGGGYGAGGKGKKKARKMSNAVIRALADASPSAILEEDRSGLTPLDYAFYLVIDLDGDASASSSADAFRRGAIDPMLSHVRALWSKREAAGGEEASRERRRWTMQRSPTVRTAVARMFERRNSGGGGRGGGGMRRGGGTFLASVTTTAAASPMGR